MTRKSDDDEFVLICHTARSAGICAAGRNARFGEDAFQDAVVTLLERRAESQGLTIVPGDADSMATELVRLTVANARQLARRDSQARRPWPCCVSERPNQEDRVAVLELASLTLEELIARANPKNAPSRWLLKRLIYGLTQVCLGGSAAEAAHLVGEAPSTVSLRLARLRAMVKRQLSTPNPNPNHHKKEKQCEDR